MRKYFLIATLFALQMLALRSYGQDAVSATLKQRMIEAKDIIRFHDQDSLDHALTFFSLTLKAWNPQLRNVNVKSQLVNNIVNYGFKDGFISPVLNMMDLASSTNTPGIVNMMNTMLNDLTPNLAQNLNQNYGLGLTVNTMNFSDLSAQTPENQLNTILSQLDLNQTDAPVGPIDIGDNLLNPQQTVGSFIDTTMKGPGSYLNRYATNSTPKAPGDDNDTSARGVFSNMSAGEERSCLQQCGIDIAHGVATGLGTSNFAKNIYGKIANVVGGAVLGGIECSTSTACNNSSDNKPTPPAAPPKQDNNPPPSTPTGGDNNGGGGDPGPKSDNGGTPQISPPPDNSTNPPPKQDDPPPEPAPQNDPPPDNSGSPLTGSDPGSSMPMAPGDGDTIHFGFKPMNGVTTQRQNRQTVGLPGFQLPTSKIKISDPVFSGGHL